MATSLKDRKPPQKPKGPTAQTGPAPDPKHNQKDPEAEKYEAEKIQLLSAMNQLRKAQSVVDKKKAELKEAQDEVNEIVNYAKAGIKGLTRQEMMGYLKDMSASKRDLIQEEATRRRRRGMLGIVTEEQLDMFSANTLSTAKDESAWRGEGYMAGMRMDERRGPEGCSGKNEQAFLAGYDDGYKAMQDAIAAEQQRRDEAKAAEEKANQPPEEEKDPEQVIRDQAKALKESGWTEKTDAPPEEEAAPTRDKAAEEAEFEAAAPPKMAGAEPEAF